MNEELLGYCVGILKPNEVIFTSFTPPRMGEFVLIRYLDGKTESDVLGMVSYIERFDRFLPEDNNPEHVESIRRIYRIQGMFRSRVSLLGRIRGDTLERLKYPPMPGAAVYRAPAEILLKIFGSHSERTHAKIGKLLTSSEVDVGIDINQVVSRHLAILAVTGGGKSNAVAVLLEEIAKRKGTVLVVDVHGEYLGSTFKGPDGTNVTNTIDVEIDLAALSAGDIAAMCGIDFDRSSRQYYVMMELVDCVKNKRRQKTTFNPENVDLFSQDADPNPPFIDDLIGTLRSMIGIKRSRGNRGNGNDSDSEDPCDFLETTKTDELIGTYIRLVNLKNKIGDKIRDNVLPIVDRIGRFGVGKINVLDLRGLDYDAMDVMISHILLNLLNERKKYVQEGEGKVKVPVVVVIEEAHIFAPKGTSTKTKYALSKVAREARKFGLGLVLVSQRPKGLDENVLSQMNNWIILRIVEPEDQKHVQRASETLSADLLQYLPSLNPGEAVLIGPFVKVPLLVKIRLSKVRSGGHDIDAISEWERFSM
ncbi:MAG: ATP-binding protein [Thermotogae bacterium]|nr:ATP-binding protein [Thermotogota bacterium]